MSTPRRTTPRYQTLADDLMHKIESGAYPLGSQFPTEFQISAEHQVSRHTVRAALARLHAMGLILRRPGAGTHVTAPTPPMRYLQEVGGLEDLLQYGQATHLELQRCERMAPPTEIAEALHLRAGTQVIRLFGRRLDEVRHEPICTTELYLRPSRALPTAALLRPETAVIAAAKVFDLRQMGHVDQSFDAISLPAEHARLLGVEAGRAALRVQRIYYGADAQRIGCAISLHPSGSFVYSMRLARRTPP